MIDDKLKSTLQDAAGKLTGPKKRAFMAKAAQDYFQGSARTAETYVGWNRHTVQLGLHERRTGITCLDNYRARGRKKTEVQLTTLEADIRDIVDGHSQADPKFQSSFYYCRVSARAVREALIEDKGYCDETLPSRQTIGTILNRMGYRLKKLKK